MSASRREIIRLSKKVASELGVSREVRKMFLLGTPEFSLASMSRDDIWRSLKYADDVINRREHSLVPSLLIMTM